MRKFTVILLPILFFSKLCYAQKQCYYPNGVRATGDFPCDPDAKDSACCGGSAGATCLTNKLCRSPDGHTIRGSCTNSDWASPDCPQYCLQARTGGHDLISCANSTGMDTSYCCDHARAFCCDEGVGRFDVLPSKPEVLARWDDRSSQFVVLLQRTSSSSSQTSTTLMASTTAPASEPIGPPAPGTSSSTLPTSNPSSDAESQPQTTPSSQLSVGAKAGIGAGAGVLLVALAAVGFLLFRLRQKKTQLAELEKERGNFNQGAAAPTYVPPGGQGNAGWYGYQHQPSLEFAPKHEVDGESAKYELPATPGGLTYR